MQLSMCILARPRPGTGLQVIILLIIMIVAWRSNLQAEFPIAAAAAIAACRATSLQSQPSQKVSAA